MDVYNITKLGFFCGLGFLGGYIFSHIIGKIAKILWIIIALFILYYFVHEAWMV